MEEIAEREGFNISKMPISSNLISEMRNFGITTIGELERITTTTLLDAMRQTGSADTTTYGFLRSILMHTDLEKYLSTPNGMGQLSTNH